MKNWTSVLFGIDRYWLNHTKYLHLGLFKHITQHLWNQYYILILILLFEVDYWIKVPLLNYTWKSFTSCRKSFHQNTVLVRHELYYIWTCYETISQNVQVIKNLAILNQIMFDILNPPLFLIPRRFCLSDYQQIKKILTLIGWRSKNFLSRFRNLRDIRNHVNQVQIGILL